jgi:hypothetical protein
MKTSTTALAKAIVRGIRSSVAREEQNEVLGSLVDILYDCAIARGIRDVKGAKNLVDKQRAEKDANLLDDLAITLEETWAPGGSVFPEQPENAA